MQIAHSALTISIPRNRNWRKPRALPEHQLDHLLVRRQQLQWLAHLSRVVILARSESGLGWTLGGGGLGSVLLSFGGDVDPPLAQPAKIGSRAVAYIGRYLVRIAGPDWH
jgi:hypothetical protein